MTEEVIIDWLLEGDISIKYQVYKDLLGETYSELQAEIERDGWGRDFLSRQNPNGYWGKSFYQPKWISTHFTMEHAGQASRWNTLRSLNVLKYYKII